MNYEQWIQIYEQMKEVLLRDETLTHIEVSFNIQPVTTEKKIARINIKTYKDGNKKQH